MKIETVADVSLRNGAWLIEYLNDDPELAYDAASSLVKAKKVVDAELCPIRWIKVDDGHYVAINDPWGGGLNPPELELEP